MNNASNGWNLPASRGRSEPDSNVGAIMPAIELSLSEHVRWTLSVEHARVRMFEPCAPPCPDLTTAVAQALGHPLDFPPFDQAVVPGDRLVLAVESCLPQIDALVPAIVDWFRQRGTPANNIGVVVAGVGQAHAPAVQERLEKRLQALVGSGVEVEVHDVDNPSRIAYVAANAQAEPIYINRAMIDADVVLPVLCARAELAVDNFGGFGVYPLVSNRDTRGTFYRWQNASPARQNAAMAQRATEAAWWSGMHMAVQVIPAPGGRISQILAGSFTAVTEQAGQQMAAKWTADMPPADLTIATLDADQFQQDWMAVARALHAASLATVEGGAIVLCSQAAPLAGPACRILSQGKASSRDVQAQLNRLSSDDALAIELLDRITQSTHLYIASQWPAELVESLGACPLVDARDVEQLCEKASAINVLPSAQNCCVVHGNP
ncbi:MAG: DUF2088 domain-containing protein [Planctomycetota bacterium]|nr:MAG: DUF2088 domain-containing protein [Planctomycetota bacterium]